MNIKMRVVAICCPSCKGTGEFGLLEGFNCMWCKGKKKLRQEDAMHYSRHLFGLSFGYVLGDLDYEDMIEMRAESSQIRKAFGEEPLQP